MKKNDELLGNINFPRLKQTFRIMKLTAVLILISMVCVFASESYSQAKTINLTMERVTVREVLLNIEDQSEYNFMYSGKIVDVSRQISISVENAKIEEVLNSVFAGTNVDYTVTDRLIVLTVPKGSQASTAQQQISVTGRVTDSSGEPLPGVTVLVKGTIQGTVTDFDGNYTITNVPTAGTLVFSFVGMRSQEVAVGNQSTINVKMAEDAIGIEEVVAIGYGTQKKVNLTGSISNIVVDEKISNRGVASVSSALSGVLPGLAVSQNSGMAGKNNISLLIRGVGTVNNANPLVVVDGMPDVDINRLNMEDIESISVLKDASSSAVYGSRAANGVILITTKTGKYMKETKIKINNSYTLQNPINSYSYMADYPRSLTLHQRAYSVNQLRENISYKDGTIDQWLALGMIDPLRYPNTDWWDVIMRTGQLRNHNVSLSGGTERSNFFISVGMKDEKGLQINNDYSLYSARANYNLKIRDNMSIGTKFSLNWSDWMYSLSEGFEKHSGAGSFAIVGAIAGITPYDPETGLYGGLMTYNENNNVFNAYSVYQHQLNHQDRQEINPSIYWDWSPFKGLSARVDYMLNYYKQFRWNADMPSQGWNFQTNSYESLIRVGENAPVNNWNWNGYKTQLTGRLNYNTVINEKHDIGALFVYSEEYWYDRSLSGSRWDRLHPSLHEIDAALTDNVGNSGASSTEGLRSYIGRMNYTAFDKYLFEASFRFDGSSRFIDKQQYGFFPSAALGWRFTEENFLKPFTETFLSSGKFRFSYGALGNNSGVGRYEQQETLAASNYYINETIVKGFVNRKMTNRDLSWESTFVTNFGLDLGFLNNRLTIEIDYYDRLTTGMNRPSEMSIHLTGAYTAPRTNIGDLRNRGVEGNFNWQDNAGELRYNINLNASYNKNNLEKWNEYLGRGTTFINMPLGFLYMYEDIGIAQTWQDIYSATPQGASPGDILRLDLNGDGRIDGNDRKAYPQFNRNRPTTNFGLTANLAWKGFDVSILLQGATGRKDTWLSIYNQPSLSLGRATTWQQWNESWSTENRGDEFPRLNGSGNENDQTFWIDDLSYLRLKNIQLGYTLSHANLTRLGIDNIRFYGTSENLITFSKFRGIDPEKQAHENDTYPLIKSFTLGINIVI